ncbi:MAG TPA: HD domain-containing protein [Candidatus Aminicenantes bacterium]|nr:HD domain-containing protein [Candidatus Aminicenantes bacterium]
MLLKQQDFYRSLTALSPGLVERVRRTIEESERRFTGGKEARGGFLWEHSVIVAAQSFRLAKAEKENPDLAAIVALLHDSGKFAGGRYHADDKPEEEEAARFARKTLETDGLKMADIGHVIRALRALYRSGASRNRLADIVHDADFLSKFGYVGVANFFVKSTLRGRNLESAAMDYLSKELTYASVLPANMRTAAARKMAVKKAADSLRFFRSYLGELNEAHGMELRVRTVDVPVTGARARQARVTLVLPASCGACGGKWETDFRTEKGPKCERLEASLRCAACGAKRSISFCLPELG